MQSQTIPILLNLVAAVLGAFGQYLFKLGSGRLGVVPLWKNWPLLAGVLIFCAVMFCFVSGFRLGGRLSVTYPIYATTFVWGFLNAVLINREAWTLLQLSGILVILLGVTLVALGSR